MGLKRVRIDYTVYSPRYVPGEGVCFDYRTLQKAKAGATRYGAGSHIYRNFNQESKNQKFIGDWWQADRCWLWDGKCSKNKQPNESIPRTWRMLEP